MGLTQSVTFGEAGNNYHQSDAPTEKPTNEPTEIPLAAAIAKREEGIEKDTYNYIMSRIGPSLQKYGTGLTDMYVAMIRDYVSRNTCEKVRADVLKQGYKSVRFFKSDGCHLRILIQIDGEYELCNWRRNPKHEIFPALNGETKPAHDPDASSWTDVTTQEENKQDENKHES